MSMSSIFRRLICVKTAPSPILRRSKFCTAATEELLRPSSPCLMLPPSFIGGGRDMVYNFYSPMKDKVVSFNNRGGREETQLMQDDKTTLVGSSHGWLALYNSRNRGMFLSNPISGRRIDLPPLAGKPFFAEVMPWKLIMSCPPDEEECRAVLIRFPGEDVAFCCPGRSSHWTPFGERLRFNDVVSGFTSNDPHFVTFRTYLDFVYSAARERFVALVYTELRRSRGVCYDIKGRDFRREVEYWDISEPSCPRMDRALEWVGPHYNWCEEPRLASAYMVSVEESGQLFLVAHRCLLRSLLDSNNYKAEDSEFHYDVYRIEDGGRLELSSSLNDVAMFVGVNHSIASPSPSPKLKGNCIYFADSRLYVHDGQYIEVFDYKKRTSSPLYFPNRHRKTQSPMTWITPTFD